MSHFEQHKDFFDKPIRLTEKEKNAPLGVIEEFFTDYRLSEIRELNDQISHVCLTSDTPPFNDPGHRDWMMSYQEDHERLMEAALILLQNEPSTVESEPVPPNQAHDDKGAKIRNSKSLDLDDLQNRLDYIQNQLSAVVAKVHTAWVEKFQASMKL